MRLMILTMCLLLILLPPFELMLAFPSVRPTCHSGEGAALLRFKESFVINCRYAFAYPKVASWKLEGNGSDCCSWDGVECDVDTGHVIGLDLNASCLYGSINSNSSLFRLAHLQNLSLAYNDFNGSQIPSALGNLSELRYLELSSSLFFGQIPSEISRLSKLSYLDLSSSHDYPPSERLLKLKMPDLRSLVQNLSSLEFLCLDSVDISSPIPAILANLSSLRGLYLYNCGLIGKFPGTVFWLPNLQALELSSNPGLTGHLPASIGNLHSIEFLDIQLCNFSGVIPFSVGNLTKLTLLYLGDNYFSGQIPPSIGNLTQLIYLSFPMNNLQGSIPTLIFTLENLESLNSFSNNLSGIIDLDTFLTLKNLKELHLSMNNFVWLEKTISSNGTPPQLTGLGLASCSLSVFPLFLRKQDKLIFLDLAYNNLHGKIPNWIWSMSAGTLEWLDLSYNYLTGLGQSPTVLEWFNLRHLNLSSNLLQGPVPIPPFSTIHYSISNNLFYGAIPRLICKASSLEVLGLSKNNLTGPIPQCLGNFSSSLSILNLESNELYGTVPPTWTNNSSVRMIGLGQNKLQGQIPRSLANCKMLEILDLCNNQLNDTFPSWMGTLPKLKILILRQNRFHGKIGSPETSLSFSKLQILDLSTNNFVGELPVGYFVCWHAMQVDVEERLSYMQADTSHLVLNLWVQNYYAYSITMINKGIEMDYARILQMLRVLDFSCNKFEGEIPELIGNLKGLRLLNLSNNILSGFIPPSIGNMAKLEALDLSENRLSGEIPQQLVQLTFLEVFNASHNHLTGHIPRGNQFDTFQNTSFYGNPGLCGEPFSVKCENTNALPAAPPPIPDESFELDWKFVLMGYASGFLFGIVIGHIVIERKRDWFLKIFRVRQTRRQGRTRRRHGN